MKSIRSLLLLAVLAIGGLSAQLAQAQYTRSFPTGECTWYVYERAKEDGWTLWFSTNSDRHAYRWWDIVYWAYRTSSPVGGSVMVLDRWDSNPYGHVAWVERSNNNDQWYVTHCNFRAGTYLGTWRGVARYGTWFSRIPGTSSVVIGTNPWSGGKRYPLRGFLVRR